MATVRSRIAARVSALVRAALVVGAIIALLLVSALGVRRFVEEDERRRYPPPGQMVDLGGGQQIHLRIWGANNAGPTFVLQASANYFSSEWAWIAPALAEDYRVVGVDRPGMGWSIGGRQPRDAQASADALGAALDIAQIDPPYVVVGHSFGGWTARLFTRDHPTEVLGLVLLDTTNANYDLGDGPAIVYGYRALVGRFGLADLIVPQALESGLPADEAEPARAVARWSTHMEASAEELAAWERSAQDVRDAGSFGDLPLLVVRASGSDLHKAQQQEMAGLSTRSTYVQLDNVGHVSMLTYQNEASLVIAELRAFIYPLTAQRAE